MKVQNYSTIRLKAGKQKFVTQFQKFIFPFNFFIQVRVFSTDISGNNKLHWWCVGWNAEEEFRPYSKSLL